MMSTQQLQKLCATLLRRPVCYIVVASGAPTSTPQEAAQLSDVFYGCDAHHREPEHDGPDPADILDQLLAEAAAAPAKGLPDECDVAGSAGSAHAAARGFQYWPRVAKPRRATEAEEVNNARFNFHVLAGEEQAEQDEELQHGAAPPPVAHVALTQCARSRRSNLAGKARWHAAEPGRELRVRNTFLAPAVEEAAQGTRVRSVPASVRPCRISAPAEKQATLELEQPIETTPEDKREQSSLPTASVTEMSSLNVHRVAGPETMEDKEEPVASDEGLGGPSVKTDELSAGSDEVERLSMRLRSACEFRAWSSWGDGLP